MSKENQGKKNRIHVISVTVILVAACVFLASSSFTLWLVSESSSAFRANLKDFIREELIREDEKIYTNVVDAIYVLGGAQCSLGFKFRTAAELYQKGISKKIMFLSRPEITEYSSLLGRNLTNDEWAIWKLEELGIPKNNVEPVSVSKGFFGTLTEAKCLSKLCISRGYKTILLISSPYHTHRVRISFEKFLKDRGIGIYAVGSHERVSLTELSIELFKLKIYEYFLVS
jgi:uncharacterized SAM-binding protein YcdF (DUF218 family)